MRSPSLTLAAAASLALVAAADVHVPSDCIDGFEHGVDTVMATVPYSYDQVMSIIGSYKNLTWSGNPADTVALNGTDNQVGTARMYELQGLHVTETLTHYSKPPAPGPYEEIHNTAMIHVPTGNLSAYLPFDGTIVSAECGGKAASFNMTTVYCATQPQQAAQLVHMLHAADVDGVSKLLGGRNFTSCAALDSSSTTTTPQGAASAGDVSKATSPLALAIAVGAAVVCAAL